MHEHVCPIVDTTQKCKEITKSICYTSCVKIYSIHVLQNVIWRHIQNEIIKFCHLNSLPNGMRNRTSVAYLRHKMCVYAYPSHYRFVSSLYLGHKRCVYAYQSQCQFAPYLHRWFLVKPNNISSRSKRSTRILPRWPTILYGVMP